MNIQSTRGKVLTATAALISLPERCQSVNRQQSLIFLGGALSGAKMVMMVRHVNGGETCEQSFSTDKQYDTCFQKSSYLPWRLKFGHLGASGYQIYFSVYRVVHLKSTIYAYADDTFIYREIKTDHDISVLQSDLDSLNWWSNNNSLQLNPSKCQFMCITRHRDKPVPSYSVNNTTLETCESL